MIISLVLPKIVVEIAGLPGTLAVLAIFAVIFAYFVAKYEDCSLRQDIADSPETVSCVASTIAQSQPDTIIHIVSATDNGLSLDGDISINTEMDINEEVFNHSENESNEKPVPVVDKHEGQEADWADQLLSKESEIAYHALGCEAVVTLKQQEATDQQFDNQPILEDISILPDHVKEFAVIESMDKQCSEYKEALIPEIRQPEIIAQKEIVEVFQETPDGILDEDELVPDDNSILEKVEEVVDEEMSEAMKQSIVIPLEADNSIMAHDKPAAKFTQPESDQLDDLLDFAFMNKEQRNYGAALSAFSRALTLYPDSDAAPFLVVEVGNLLKNMGAYDEAIKVFTDGRNLSQTKQDEMLEQEFISTIAYLRIIKNILTQSRLGCVPFLEIPPHVLKEIDEEFKEWRNVGNI
ncbi:tetratricopeptide repeat protein [Sporomusa carbonis]|uniref:tetratricopeptide repeat protein n=1 Tax=Sporomusa carbonis TaxID=3076075 RepID=UPI003C79F82B